MARNQHTDLVFASIRRHEAAIAALRLIDARVDKAAYEKASDEEDAAFEQIVDTIPQTMAGLRASIEYVSRSECTYPEARTRFLETLLKSPLLAPGTSGL
jgi:hypothetical protein